MSRFTDTCPSTATTPQSRRHKEDVLAVPGAPLLFYALDGPVTLRLAATPARRLRFDY